MKAETIILTLVGLRILWTILGVTYAFCARNSPGSGNLGVAALAICPELMLPHLFNELKNYIWRP